MPAAKKLVNIFFSLVLIAGLLPVTAFASPDQGPEENANGKAVVVDQGDAGESASGSETVPSNSNEAGESNSPELDSAKLGNDSDSDGSQDVQGATSSQEDSDLENSWRYTNGVLTVQDDSNGVDMYSNDSSRAGKTAVRSGIDVSEHNGTIDWDKAKADGVDFAILRIGFIHDNGRGRSDYQWERNVSECERLGIPYGVYVYSYAETASHASTEADFVLQRLKGHNPSYPVYYDLEDNCQLSVAQNHGMGALAQTFCNKIAAAGYTPGVYANTNWWTNYLTDSCFGNWEKWVAQYNSSCTYKGNYSIWQYTSSGYVDGIDGRVDMNFDYEKDRAFDNSYRLEIAPKNVSAAASGSGEVTLSWDAVEGADAYAVAEYVDGGYRTFTTSCSATSYKVSGLSNGKRHGFLVQARVGGKWSAVSTDLLAYATPQGATKPEPKAEPGNGSVKLTWDKVPGATKYAVTREDTTTAVYIDGDSYEAKGLKNGTTYAFHVRALIDGSWTLLTDDAVCATPFSPAVPKVSASLDGEVVHLKWNEIPGADRYAVALKMGAEYKTYTYDCGQTEFTVKDLNPGAYTFLVQSHSDNGWSSFNDNDLVSITVPDANSPKVTVDYRDGDSIVLSWNPIPGATKYAVAECKNGSFSNFTTEYADTQFEIRNLGFGVKHRYLVQAYVNGSWNKFTESDYAEAFVSDKSSPDVMAVASADGQVTLSWEKVSGASKYAIAEYVEGGYRTFTTSCTDLSYVVNDLGNGHEHKFLVQAFVDGRWSVASADLLVSTTPHGVMAPAATAKAGDLSATLQWGRVPGATRYAVAAQNGDGSFTTYTYSCTGLSYTVKGLVSGRTYKMLVQAYVDGKWSPFSSVDLVSVKPYGTNVPTGQQMMSGIANGSGFTSNTSYLILVNRSRHEVGVFRGNFNNWSCIKFWSCVTGAPSTPTITGEYKTTGFKRTNLTTDARARWCTQINGGYFFHSILASNNELGSSQSHGCIRLAVENAKWIYDNIMQGTKVYIY